MIQNESIGTCVNSLFFFFTHCTLHLLWTVICNASYSIVNCVESKRRNGIYGIYWFWNWLIPLKCTTVLNEYLTVLYVTCSSFSLWIYWKFYFLYCMWMQDSIVLILSLLFVMLLFLSIEIYERDGFIHWKFCLSIQKTSFLVFARRVFNVHNISKCMHSIRIKCINICLNSILEMFLFSVLVFLFLFLYIG